MNGAQHVIAKFSGQSALARLLGKTPSTVQSWARVGIIPAKWHAPLLALAQEQGVELYPGDFIHTDGLGESSGVDIADVPFARWPGALKIGNFEVPVYVLSDGQRVLSRVGATYLISGVKGGGDLNSYIGVESLKGYLPDDLSERMIEFNIAEVTNGKTVLGMTAETFLDICTAYVRAFDEEKLATDRQKAIAIKASMFLAACAKEGLVALIDEVTGYQYVRAEDALQFKLRLYLAEEMRKWESTFPSQLWEEFGRLTHWKGAVHQRPKYWGKLVMELIYGYLDPDVAEWLRKNNPKPQKGQNHHQWMSGQYGLKKLTEHIWMVIGFAKSCDTMSELKTRMAERSGRQPIQERLYLPPPSQDARFTKRTL